MESSTGPVAPLEGSPDLPSRENLSVVQEAQVNQKQDSQKPGATSKDSGTVSPSKENQVKKKATPSNSEKPEKQVSHNNKPKKPLKSLKDFPFDEIDFKWYREENDNVFRKAIADLGIKGDKGDIDHLVKILGIAADIIRELFRGEKEFYKNLHEEYNYYFRNTPHNEKPTIEKFDDYLYRWAFKMWPRAFEIILAKFRR